MAAFLVTGLGATHLLKGAALAADRLQEVIEAEVRRLLPDASRLNAQEILQRIDGYDAFHFNIPKVHYFQRFAHHVYQRSIDPAERRPALILFYESSGSSLRDTWEAIVFEILHGIFGDSLVYGAANLAVNPEALSRSLDGERFDLPAVHGTPSLALFTVEGGKVRHYDTEYIDPGATIDIAASVREKIERWIGPVLYRKLKVLTYEGRNYTLMGPSVYRNTRILLPR